MTGTQFAAMVGFGFSFPFLPLLVQELGVTDRAELALWSGIVIGISGIAMAVASPIWGLLADRFGRKLMLVRAVGSSSVSLALQAVVTNVWQLAATRTFHGAFTATQSASAMLIASVAPRERTGFALGMMNTGIQLGNLTGPLLGGIAIASIGLRASFLLGAAVLAACTVAVWVLAEDVPVSPRAKAGAGVRGVARDIFTPFAWPTIRGALVMGVGVQIVYASTSALIAIYVQDLARPSWLSLELAIGLAVALGALSAAIAMPILGSWADRNDPRLLLAASLAAVGVSLVPQALIPNALAFVALRAVIGVGIAGTTCALAVLTRAGAPVGGEGRSFGAFAAAQNIGSGVGPILGSAFAAAAGIPALYVAGALIMIVLLPAALFAHSWFALDSRVIAE